MIDLSERAGPIGFERIVQVIRIEFPPAVMTREVAAYYIGGTLADLDLLKRQKKITPVGQSKRVKYLKTDLDRYIESLEERAPKCRASEPL